MAPSGSDPTLAPVARASIHIFPFQAATTRASSGEMVANPLPEVLAMFFTTGEGGDSRVTSITQRLFPEAADTGASMYFPSRETRWQATHFTWSAGLAYVVAGLPVM